MEKKKRNIIIITIAAVVLVVIIALVLSRRKKKKQQQARLRAIEKERKERQELDPKEVVEQGSNPVGKIAYARQIWGWVNVRSEPLVNNYTGDYTGEVLTEEEEAYQESAFLPLIPIAITAIAGWGAYEYGGDAAKWIGLDSTNKIGEVKFPSKVGKVKAVVTGEDGKKWYKVDYKGKTGYVRSDVVDLRVA